ncbi:hypothetical protein PCANB_002404 [Pneumocystis canis]|nr:hypothetical protein PCANB_002404 [Pneumocystis canis]
MKNERVKCFKKKEIKCLKQRNESIKWAYGLYKIQELMRFSGALIAILLGLNTIVARSTELGLEADYKDYYEIYEKKDTYIRSLANMRWLPWYGRPIDK